MAHSHGAAAAASPIARAARRALSATPLDPLVSRGAYRHFERIQTRWNDNDQFGHINNAVYCESPAIRTGIEQGGANCGRSRF